MKEIWIHKTDKTISPVVVTYNSYGHKIYITNGHSFYYYGYDVNVLGDYKRVA